MDNSLKSSNKNPKKVWITEMFQKPLLRVTDSRKINESLQTDSIKIYEEQIKKAGINESVQEISTFFPGWFPGKYVYHGPCAYFDGEKNDNERLYDENDYVQHIGYLVEQAKQGILFGSSDHDEDFNVSMKSVSHIIRNIYYKKEVKEVWIEIEIIPTLNGNGQDLIAIIEAGSPLFISARATGYMDDKGNVTVDTIYTYDVVYRPGFRRAKMTKMTTTKNYGDNVAIYEWIEDKKINTPKNQNQMEEKFVTEKQLEQFTKGISEQLASFKAIFSNASFKSSLNESFNIKNGKTNFAGKKPIRINENLDATKTPEEIATSLADSNLKIFSKPVLEYDNIYDCYYLAEAAIANGELECVTMEDKGFPILMKYNKDLTLKVANDEDFDFSSKEVLKTDFEGIVKSTSTEDQEKIYSNIALALEGKETSSQKIFENDEEKAVVLSGEEEKSTPITSADLEPIAELQLQNKTDIESVAESQKVIVKKVNEALVRINEIHDFANNIAFHLKATQINTNEVVAEVNRLNEGLAETTMNLAGIAKTISDSTEEVVALKDFSVVAQQHIARLENEHDNTVITVNEMIDVITDLKPTPTATFAICDGCDTTEEAIASLLQDDESIISCDLAGSEKICTIKLDKRQIEDIINQNPEIFKSGVMVDSTESGEKTVESMVESVKKRKAQEQMILLENKYKFISKFNESLKTKFKNLNELQQNKVAEEMTKETNLNEAVLSGVIDRVSNEEELSLMFKSIPKELIPVWEGLAPAKKRDVTNLFKRKGIKHQADAELFWESLEIGKIRSNDISESRMEFKNQNGAKDDDLGYTVPNLTNI